MKKSFNELSAVQAKKYLSYSDKVKYMISFKNEDEATILADIKGLSDMKQSKDYENRFDKLEKIVLNLAQNINFLTENLNSFKEEVREGFRLVNLRLDALEENTRHVWKNQNI